MALVECLARESNRDYSTAPSLNNPAWNGQQQQEHWGLETAEADLCEGYGKFRSAVRENALWALVMLCTHEAAARTGDATAAVATALADVITDDANSYAVGHAMDALRRLVAATAAATAGGGVQQQQQQQHGQQSSAAVVGSRPDNDVRAMYYQALAKAAVAAPCSESLLRTVLP